jgi:hypothetical protein
VLGKIIETGQDTVYIKLSEKSNFKLGEEVIVNKPKKIRTIPQNNLYWCMLDWAVHPQAGRLCEQGRLSKDGLHLDIKVFMENNHKHDFLAAFDEKGRFTTTKLTRYEFGLFFDFVNLEIMIEYYKLDMSPFWKDYERFGKWRETNPGGMDDYLVERLPF